MSSQQPGKQYNVAVVGATGVVGLEFLKIAAERRFPLKGLKLLATERSAGKRIPFGEGEITVEATTHDSFKGADFVFISASGAASREYAPIARDAGAIVIDDSSVWRQDPDVPLVVPEVNPDDVDVPQGHPRHPQLLDDAACHVPLAAAQAQPRDARHRRHVPVRLRHRHRRRRRARRARRATGPPAATACRTSTRTRSPSTFCRTSTPSWTAATRRRSGR